MDDQPPRGSWSCCTRVVLYTCCVTFILVFGVCFHYIESPIEQVARDEYIKQLHIFAGNHSCVSKQEVQNLVKLILQTRTTSYAELDEDSHWDIISSIFFSAAIVTTIGYGTTPPATDWGRIFAVFCAVIGMPLFMICMAQASIKMKGHLGVLGKLIHKLTEKRRLKRIIELAFVISSGFIIFMLLPAVLFWQVEGWTYSEALYYCIVTLLTIGFGDFIPSLRNYTGTHSLLRKSMYLLIVCLWMVIGLVWMAAIISLIQRIISSTTEKLTIKFKEMSSVSNMSYPLVTEEENKEDTKDKKISPSLNMEAVRFRRNSSVMIGN